MNDSERGWVAGLLEGEGCFHLKSGGTGAYINCSMTDEDTIRRLHEVVGAGTVTFSEPRGTQKKPVWTWRTGAREDVIRLVGEILPLMGARRSAKIASILAAYEANPRIRVIKNDVVHGIRGGYAKGCRCDSCRKAQNDYQQDYRRRKENGQVGKRGVAILPLEERIAQSRTQD